MANETSPVPTSPVILPQSPSNKRPIYIFILILIILAAAVIAGAAYFGKSYFTKVPAPVPEKPTTLTGLEAAERLEQFLNKSIKPDGSFELLYACEPGKCIPAPQLVAQDLINSFWDTPGRKVFNGDYGFVDTLDKDKTTKYTVDNAWVGRLLLRTNNQKFSLPE